MSLNIKELTVGYIKDLPVLRNVSIEAKKGSITAIVGPNGAGKSTLFKAIFGFLRPTSGSIEIDGEDITGTEPYRIRIRSNPSENNVAWQVRPLRTQPNRPVVLQVTSNLLATETGDPLLILLQNAESSYALP